MESPRETVAAKTENGQRNESSKIVGQLAENSLCKSGNAHTKNVGHFSGQIPANASARNGLQGNAHQESAETPNDLPNRKSLGKSGNAQRFSAARTERFRYELDFRRRDLDGYQALIRRRLKWPKARYANTITIANCRALRRRMVERVCAPRI